MPLPINAQLPKEQSGEVLLKVGDDITTDHIMPAGSKILPLRSNIPAISEYVFSYVDPTFARRAKEKSGGFIVAGQNYGQGSSREHAALAPMYLGVKAVIAKSFSRMHKANLINFGIIPLEFANPADFDAIRMGDAIKITDVSEALKQKSFKIQAGDHTIEVANGLTERQADVIRAGGLLNYIRARPAAKKIG
jgi:aconitate hydratase